MEVMKEEKYITVCCQLQEEKETPNVSKTETWYDRVIRSVQSKTRTGLPISRSNDRSMQTHVLETGGFVFGPRSF